MTARASPQARAGGASPVSVWSAASHASWAASSRSPAAPAPAAGSASPTAIAARPPMDGRMTPAAALVNAFSRPRILVVDDDYLVAAATSGSLRDGGFEVIETAA